MRDELARREHRLGRYVLGIVAFVLAACSGSDGRPVPPSPPDDPVVSDPEAGALIGPEGGTVTHPGGARVVVPVGALATPTWITLQPAHETLGVTLAGTRLGRGLEAGPDGLVFRQPVEVIVPYDPGLIPAGEDPTKAQVHMASRGATRFEALDSRVDLAAREIHAFTTHFTQFVPAQNPNPLFITTETSLPDATVSSSYSQQLAAAGGTAPYTWSLAAGSALPASLSLGTGGLLSGVPASAGAHSFFVVANDAAGNSVQKAFALKTLPPVAALPILSSISPSSAPEDGASVTISLAGSGFVPTSSAYWDTEALATTFVSSTELTAAIPAALLTPAGTHQVTVRTPAPGGGTSAAVPFDVTPAVGSSLVITTPFALPEATARDGYGLQFAATGGTPPYAWTVSPGSTLPEATALSSTGAFGGTLGSTGTFAFFVTVSDTAGHSVQKEFQLVVVQVPLPVATGVSPASAPQGIGDLTISVTGSGFIVESEAHWDGAPLPSNQISPTEVRAVIPAAYLAVPGTHVITIRSPGPGGGSSADLPFDVTSTSQNPIPTIASVSPTRVAVGTVDVQVAITGTNFVASSAAAIGSQGIPTRYLSSTRIDATIPASYLAAPGTLQLRVYNPPPGGGYSATSTPLTVEGAGITCVATYRNFDCTTRVETEANVNFWRIPPSFNNNYTEGTLGTDSPGLKMLLGTSVDRDTAFFRRVDPTEVSYTAVGFSGGISRSGDTIDVSVDSVRFGGGGPPDCQLPLIAVVCSGSGELRPY